MSTVPAPPPAFQPRPHDDDPSETPNRGKANPDFRIVAILAGAAIGAIVGIVLVAVLRPSASTLAATAITAIAAVAGGAISVGAATMYFRQLADGRRSEDTH
jgi:hypothetical protein